ncbi:MAG: FAD-dependent oxidoreductase, partial [Gammaproteobacteria bacterium]|nr:FAD-dependent oxidoreductase [Gammaproteobacteria bacterium]
MADDNALPLEVLLARLATVVGAEHARELPKGARYGALLPSGLTRRARPRAVVTPASAEQIQQLVGLVPRLAHEVWWTPDASGHGARVGDGRRPAVLLDLSRLARIVEIDRHDGCAVLDAGVSHAALHAHLRERELPFRSEVEANGASAVLGTLLEGRWSVGPWGEREAFYCGFEAVLPNGTLLRTGMGALPGSDCWARTRYAYGPALEGLCGRGGLGIVTRYGLWLAPRPRQSLPFAARLADVAAVAAAIETLRPLLLAGTVPGTVGIANER